MDLFGFFDSDNVIGGSENVEVGTTTIYLPLIGTGKSADGVFRDAGFNFSKFRLTLEENLPSGTLTGSIYDSTTATTLCSLTIASGNISGLYNSTTQTINVNDAVFLGLSLSTGTIILPTVHWRLHS